MTDHERAFELFVGINPVPDPDMLRSELVAAPAFLAALENRSTTMQTSQVRELPRVEPPPMLEEPRRRWTVAAAAAFVIAVLIGVGAWLAFGGSGDEPDVIDSPIPTTGPYGLPDFSSDPTIVGAALTAAQNAHDTEVFLSLFAEDAELRFREQVFSPADIRAGVELPFTGNNYQLDRSWARIMNESESFSCEVNGDRALCDVTITSDWLDPLLPPIPYNVAIQMQEGKLVMFWPSLSDDPADVMQEAFKVWTFENYPEEALLMWRDADSGGAGHATEIRTEESARLHLRLGQEYVAQLEESTASQSP